jgi:hydroxymethylglutaryl-CoA reductase
VLRVKTRTAEPAMAPRLSVLTNARHLQVGIKILSNLADRRLVSGDVSIPVERLATASLDGMQVAQAIAAAYRFAYADPYRACTHNKVRRGQANRFLCICRQESRGPLRVKGREFGLHFALD